MHVSRMPYKGRCWLQSISPPNSLIQLTKSPGGGEQIIRPIGLIDPQVEIRPVKSQIDDLLAEIRNRAANNQRVLVTTLTKRMVEDLANYYTEVGIRCRCCTPKSRPSSASASSATSAAASTTSHRHQPPPKASTSPKSLVADREGFPRHQSRISEDLLTVWGFGRAIALTQIDQNIDAFGFTEDDKTRVVETVGEVRASIKGGTFASHGFALLSTLKEIFEHTAGHLLAAGILHELAKILS